MTETVDHLWNKHFARIHLTPTSGNRLAFRDSFRGEDYLPLGQWLLAMEHCRYGHDWQLFGSHHFGCPSDNCDYCARCGVEHHD